MVIMLGIQVIAYVKSAKILIANLVQVKSTGHQTKQKFGFIKRVDEGWITTVKDLKSFPRNKFGMSETSCWIGLFSKFVKFHLVKTGNRQGITHRRNVVQDANLSLIKRSKMRQKESTARMHRRFSALSVPSLSPCGASWEHAHARIACESIETRFPSC